MDERAVTGLLGPAVRLHARRGDGEVLSGDLIIVVCYRVLRGDQVGWNVASTKHFLETDGERGYFNDNGEWQPISALD